MSLISVEPKQKEVKEKVKPLYGTTGDLAKAVVDNWANKNLLLLRKADEALSFIRDDLSNKKKTFFDKFFYGRNIRIRNYQKIFRELARELQFLVNEIEYLIGFDTYMKAGVKHKFKNKKFFDDKLSEYREITAMINGILFDLSLRLESVHSFKHELETLISVSRDKDKDETDSSYYYRLFLLLSTLRFE